MAGDAGRWQAFPVAPGRSRLRPRFPVPGRGGVQRDHGQRREDGHRGCAGRDLPEEGKAQVGSWGGTRREEEAWRAQVCTETGSPASFPVSAGRTLDAGLAPSPGPQMSQPSSPVCPGVSPPQTGCPRGRGWHWGGWGEGPGSFLAPGLVSEDLKAEPSQVSTPAARPGLRDHPAPGAAGRERREAERRVHGVLPRGRLHQEAGPGEGGSCPLRPGEGAQGAVPAQSRPLCVPRSR